MKKSSFVTINNFSLTVSTKLMLIALYKKFGKNAFKLIDNMTSCDSSCKYEMKKYLIKKYHLSIEL